MLNRQHVPTVNADYTTVYYEVSIKKSSEQNYT